MSQKPVEIILMRQLAGHLAMPIMVFDPAGNVLFFNEPAENLIGRRFDETGEIQAEELYANLELTIEDGSPLPREARALVTALEKREAAHSTSWMRKADGSRKRMEATAFPLEGQGGRHLGAVLIFWESHKP